MLDSFPGAQPLHGLIGGLLIGFAGAVMLLGLGRIAGVSGIAARAAGLGGDMPIGSAWLFLAGLPIGAMVATTAITAGLKVGDLGSTFGGGPVPCAAALANLEVIRRDRLVDNAVMVGDHIRRAASRIPAVVDISGRGLLLGLKLDRPAAGVQRALFESRVLTGTASDPNILRLMPPLSFSRSEANLLIDALRRVLS